MDRLGEAEVERTAQHIKLMRAEVWTQRALGFMYVAGGIAALVAAFSL